MIKRLIFQRVYWTLYKLTKLWLKVMGAQQFLEGIEREISNEYYAGAHNLIGAFYHHYGRTLEISYLEQVLSMDEFFPEE